MSLALADRPTAVAPSGTTESAVLADVIARATTSADFRELLLNDPHGALADAGLSLPEGVNVRFVERPADVDLMIALPPVQSPRPALTDPELQSAVAIMDGCGWDRSLCTGDTCIITCWWGPTRDGK